MRFVAGKNVDCGIHKSIKIKMYLRYPNSNLGAPDSTKFI